MLKTTTAKNKLLEKQQVVFAALLNAVQKYANLCTLCLITPEITDFNLQWFSFGYFFILVLYFFQN